MVGMLGFEPSQEQSSTAKGIIRPSRVPTPTPKICVNDYIVYSI